MIASPMEPLNIVAPGVPRVRKAAPGRPHLRAQAAVVNAAVDDVDGAPRNADASHDVEVTEDAAPVNEISVYDLLIGEQVGEGTTATVFVGAWQGKVVAIKEMNRMRRIDLKEQVAFTRELAVLNKLHHPHLVQFWGASLSSNPFKIVTEYCDGGTLFELLYSDRDFLLSWSQKIKIAVDVADGMCYLHKHNVIHRDLKSLNLLLAKKVTRSDDAVDTKITDFGLSKVVAASQGKKVEMTKMIGTIHWMAPEVFTMTDYSEKVDVYSFAMVLYELVAQEPPFEDQDHVRIPLLVTSGKRPSLSKCPPEVPEEMLALMVKSWAAESGDRPSFDELFSVMQTVTPP